VTWPVDFLTALQFLTVAAPFPKRIFTPAEMGRAVGYYPLIGLLLGALCAGADALLGQIFPPLIQAALVLALWGLLTGGLHLDGFLDACDGLFGGSTPERRLEIMRDHRIGAFAFTGGALLFLLKFSTLASLGVWRLPALLLAPLLGRWAMSLAVIAFPYARAEGLGHEIKAHASWRQAVLACFVSLAAAWFVAGWHGLAACLVAGLALLGITRFVLTRIPGLTGDIYGAICEVTELSVLLLFSVRGFA
jgi:adenosylcobinamide-GDP ribazoletransferase